MRINNNIMAMNTHRQYGINNTNVAKSVEKLSSGYRINRAGDDAAGLAISEKMRAQIRGLTMASKNSQDAISLVQTAEGALQETHNILQRMRELAVQSASDTNETTIDRDALNKEFQALIAEIDDTANKAKFNDQNLIDGTFTGKKFTGTVNGGTATVTVNDGTPAANTAAMWSIVEKIGAATTTYAATLAGSAANLYTATASGVADGNYTVSYAVTADTTTSPTSGTKPAQVSYAFTALNGVTGATVEFTTMTSGAEAAFNNAALSGLTVTGSNNDATISITVGSTVFSLSSVDLTTADLASTGVALTDGSGNTLTLKLTGYSAGASQATNLLSDFGSGVASTNSAAIGSDGVNESAGGTTAGNVTFTVNDGVNSYTGTAAEGATSATIAVGTGSISLSFGAITSLAGAPDLTSLLGATSGALTIGVTSTTTGNSTFLLQHTDANGKVSERALHEGMDHVLIGGYMLDFTALTSTDINQAALEAIFGTGSGSPATEIAGTEFVVQTGANKGDELKINIDAMDSKLLGVDYSNVANREASSLAIDEVNDAINKVSTQRAALGALQNRLEHKIANLDTSAENLQAAEARIRDLDMAKEMTTFTRNNILSQAATAMLAQANSLPQGVLQLLR